MNEEATKDFKYCPICNGELNDKNHKKYNFDMELAFDNEGLAHIQASALNLHCMNKGKACEMATVDIILDTEEPCLECGSHIAECITMDNHKCKICGLNRGIVWDLVEEDLENSEYLCPYCHEKLRHTEYSDNPLFCCNCRNITSIDEEDWYAGIYGDDVCD